MISMKPIQCVIIWHPFAKKLMHTTGGFFQKKKKKPINLIPKSNDHETVNLMINSLNIIGRKLINAFRDFDTPCTASFGTKKGNWLENFFMYNMI